MKKNLFTELISRTQRDDSELSKTSYISRYKNNTNLNLVSGSV